MKKILMPVIMICILLLIAIDVKIMLNLNDIKSNLGKDVDLLQSQIDDLKAEEDMDEKVEDEKKPQKENQTEIAEIPLGEVDKDKFKVCTKVETCYYTKEESIPYEDFGVDVEISDQKAYITLDAENEILQSIAGSVYQKNLKSVEDMEIKGFSAKPLEVYFAEFGQEISEEKILFLMDDGMVEYISVVDMLETQNYKSAGKIKKLQDIKQFDILTVSDTDGGGYITTIAIDQDGYYYDLNELL